MAELTVEQAAALAGRLAAKLDERCREYRKLDGYAEGRCTETVPAVITAANISKAYRRLMPLAEAPWGALVAESVLDRLEPTGLESADNDKADVESVWRAWQENSLDAGSMLAHDSACVSGRAFALVWPDPENGDKPDVSLDTSEQMIVQYRAGTQDARRRVAALRRWVDDDGATYATLYRAEALYKFRAATPGDRDASPAGWAPRVVLKADGSEEPWPLPNPFNVVPVVEVAVNRRLKPGSFGYARGEFAHCLGLIDRLQVLTFIGLVVAFWQGFPLRGLIGDKILRDDDDKPIAPIKADPGAIAQIENPAGKIFQFDAADRDNLAIYPELSQLAAITKTPRHYFPLAQAMANLSADAIRADEGALNAKVTKHKGSLGEGWEEVLRVCGLMLPDSEVTLSPRAELQWADHESRSLAERADAAVKLKDIMPWQALAAKVLNATQAEIGQWAAMRSADGFGQLLAAAAPAVSPGGVVLPNGNVPAAA